MAIDLHAHDGWEIPAEWKAEDFKGWPKESYKLWNEYDRKRYVAYRKQGSTKQAAVKEDMFKKLEDKLAELGVDDKELNALIASMKVSRTAAPKVSNMEKLFGMTDAAVGTKVPLQSAMFYSEDKKTKMSPSETLIDFIGRVGNICQKYTKSQIEGFVKDFNAENNGMTAAIEDDFIVLK